MAHKRQQIREAAKAQLLGRTSAGARVETSRVIPFRKVELPAIAIYTQDEDVDPNSRSTAPRELTRTVQLKVEGALRPKLPTDNLDDLLDDLALEIERAIHADETLNGTAADTLLAGTEIEIAEEAAQLLGVVILTFGVTYRTGAPEAEDVALDAFKTADIRHSLAGAQPAGDQAHDVVTNLEA